MSKDTASWSVGLVEADGPTRVLVTINGIGICLTPDRAKSMARALKRAANDLLDAEEFTEEGGQE